MTNESKTQFAQTQEQKAHMPYTENRSKESEPIIDIEKFFIASSEVLYLGEGIAQKIYQSDQYVTGQLSSPTLRVDLSDEGYFVPIPRNRSLIDKFAVLLEGQQFPTSLVQTFGNLDMIAATDANGDQSLSTSFRFTRRIVPGMDAEGYIIAEDWTTLCLDLPMFFNNNWTSAGKLGARVSFESNLNTNQKIVTLSFSDGDNITVRNSYSINDKLFTGRNINFKGKRLILGIHENSQTGELINAVVLNEFGQDEQKLNHCMSLLNDMEATFQNLSQVKLIAGSTSIMNASMKEQHISMPLLPSRNLQK